MGKPLNISDEARVQMPMKTVISLIIMVALGTFGFFQIQEKLNQHATKIEIMEKDLKMNSEFRIKWPRGILGSLPADSEQFLLIEDLYKSTEKLQDAQEAGMHNTVNIERLQKDVEKILNDIEKLKDASREMKFSNGNGAH